MTSARDQVSKLTQHRLLQTCVTQEVTIIPGRFGGKNGFRRVKCKDFFSRLKAKRRRHANEEISLEYALEEEKEQERNNFLNAINEDLNLQHPVMYDIFCLCDHVKESKLARFNVSMLKEILKLFDVSFHSRDRKKDLSDKLSTFVKTCECFS